ncbi:MAG: DUF2200 domain-containing protein [Salibacteraceae bacterium]
MKKSAKQDERIANMTFASIYPHYLKKVQKKGRTKEELHDVIKWLTGYDDNELQRLIISEATTKEFFEHARLNEDASKITGSICGYNVQEIDNELTRSVRYMDKLVDELARGWSLDKIFRKQP